MKKSITLDEIQWGGVLIALGFSGAATDGEARREFEKLGTEIIKQLGLD